MLFEIKPTPEVVEAYFIEIIRFIAAKLRFHDAEWQSAPELLDKLNAGYPEVHKALAEFHGHYGKWAAACLAGKQGTPEMMPLIQQRDTSRNALVWAVDNAKSIANLGRDPA
jgi:hypothetical protein